MKRGLALLFTILLLLTGCQKTPPAAPPAPPEEKEPVVELPVKKPEQENPPAAAPEAERPPVSMPEADVDPTPVTPVIVPEVNWCAVAQEAYVTVTDREQFQVLIAEPDGTVTELTVMDGVNDWNVEHVEYSFAEFDWSAAAEADWTALENDRRMSFYVPGEISLSCTQNGDIVKITTPEETKYLRAVHPAPNELASNLYSLMSMVPEDVVSYQIGYVTVDGSLSPEEAARAIAEKRAENHRNAPEWIEWKVSDAQAGEAEVYDIYRGEPQEFCCNIRIKVYFRESAAANHVRWQAGAGLQEPYEDGYWSYFSQLHVQKNTDGDWMVVGGGTGGYMVRPVKEADKPQLDWLVELFCLTEGVTHDSVVPYLILELPAEQLAHLPELLDQLTEQESRALCLALQQKLAEGHAIYTMESLQALLGDYTDYLNA